MAKPKKPPRKKPIVAAAVEPETAPAEAEVARYTWAQIRAKVQPPTAEALATYAVRAPRAGLVATGAKLRSERILTDLRTWIGHIINWWSKLSPKARAAVVGFSDVRLQVVVHHAFALRDLAARAGTPTAARADHAEAVALADGAYRDAQQARQTLRAALDQAAVAAPGFAEKVDAADEAASEPVALQRTLGALLNLLKDTQAKGGPVAEVLTADGFTPAAVARFEAKLTALHDTHESTRGASGGGPVAQDELDAQDGVCLTYMSGLRAFTRQLRATDRSAPLLQPRATASFFGSRTAAPPLPEPTS